VRSDLFLRQVVGYGSSSNEKSSGNLPLNTRKNKTPARNTSVYQKLIAGAGAVQNPTVKKWI
ncbi:MAG: hypothetical protein VYE62_12430, partial [Pseudomonadota bacterium]|nr:hypothetical protein [Pseudomonadota bacterium]